MKLLVFSDELIACIASCCVLGPALRGFTPSLQIHTSPLPASVPLPSHHPLVHLHVYHHIHCHTIIMATYYPSSGVQPLSR